MFVGRVRELAALEEALEAARSGRGVTALISGDAGIGKSRLVAELAAHAPGCTVLTGRCLDLVGTELAYQPFAEALGGLPERADQVIRGSWTHARLDARRRGTAPSHPADPPGRSLA